MDKKVRNEIIAKARKVVVKVGTNSICDQAGKPSLRAIENLARQISKLMQSGISVTLVASGAIGAGLSEMQMNGRPKNMPDLQAVAAVGQGQLMRIFHDVFAKLNIHVAQVLVTRDDFVDRTRYINIRNTLSSLAGFGALPIINENDTVAVEEIRFGENDILAATVTTMTGAQLLVLLTVVDGLLENGKLIDVVEKVDEKARSLVQNSKSKFGSGGMGTKLQAARMVTQAGEAAVIANANTTDILVRLLSGEKLGTVFIPAQKKLSSRKRWIGLTARTAGRITVDDGAAKAVIKNGKSLLASGITAVEGDFIKGDTVSVFHGSDEIARGLTNYDSAQVNLIKGLKTNQIAKILGDKPYDAVIHRDNMTISETNPNTKI